MFGKTVLLVIGVMWIKSCEAGDSLDPKPATTPTPKTTQKPTTTPSPTCDNTTPFDGILPWYSQVVNAYNALDDNGVVIKSYVDEFLNEAYWSRNKVNVSAFFDLSLINQGVLCFFDSTEQLQYCKLDWVCGNFYINLDPATQNYFLRDGIEKCCRDYVATEDCDVTKECCGIDVSANRCQQYIRTDFT